MLLTERVNRLFDVGVEFCRVAGQLDFGVVRSEGNLASAQADFCALSPDEGADCADCADCATEPGVIKYYFLDRRRLRNRQIRRSALYVYFFYLRLRYANGLVFADDKLGGENARQKYGSQRLYFGQVQDVADRVLNDGHCVYRQEPSCGPRCRASGKHGKRRVSEFYVALADEGDKSKQHQRRGHNYRVCVQR